MTGSLTAAAPPPDPTDDDARLQPGASGDQVKSEQHDFAAVAGGAVKWSSRHWLAALSRRIWLMTYSLERARAVAADRHHLLRESAWCIALAVGQFVERATLTSREAD